MADRKSHLAGGNLGQFSNRNSVKSLSPDRRSAQSSQGPSRTSVKSLRMSYIAARQSILTNARHSRQSLMPQSAGRIKQRRQAKEMEKAIHERAKHQKIPAPAYDFLEMIGKGTYGRVYKCRKFDSKSIVSVKIMDVDSSDYQLDVTQKDQALKDFQSETSILNTLKQSKARNVNMMHEAFPFYSQLWIVTEYCPGGSVHTLMRAWDGNRLEEKHIITIARELAVAVKSVHDVGIIHRDIKAANVLIREDGQVQLCDFGVAAVLESNFSKRQTFIGTPFWMPPEMHGGIQEEGPDPTSDQLGNMIGGYSQEVDIWAYGCTIYEMATGRAPNTNIDPRRLHLFLKTAPRLEGEEYSEALQAFVAFCLVVQPKLRPSADYILGNPYIKNSEEEFPTSLLKELVERYTVWEMSGGERASLFNAFGAQGPEALPELPKDDDIWNFSMTDEFGEEVITQIVQEAEEHEVEDDESVPGLNVKYDKERDRQVTRGDRKLARLFDLNQRPYEYSNDDADVTLRDDFETSNARGSVIDMGDMDTSFSDFSAVTSKRDSTGDFYGNSEMEENDEDLYARSVDEQDKRATAEWKFPTQDPEFEKRKTAEWKFPSRESEEEKRTTREWKFPPTTESAHEQASSIEQFEFPTLHSRDESGEIQDFQFPRAETPPSVEKRKTTEWSFSTAEYVTDEDVPHSFNGTLTSTTQHAYGDSGSSASLSHLKHAGTTPAAESATHPGENFGEAELDAGSRFGSVDLDTVEHVVEESRPATSYTLSSMDDSFSIDSHNDEPFGLDEPISTNMQRPYHSGSRLTSSSFSQFEPNPDVDEEERREDKRALIQQAIYQQRTKLSDPSAQLSRGPSVKASMDVLRHRDDDDDDDDDPASTHTLTQKRVVREGSGPQLETDSLDYSNTGTARRANAPPALTVDTTSTMKKSSANRVERRALEKKARKHPRQLLAELPDIKGVDPAALEEGVPKEVMSAELKRLWGGMQKQLEVAEALLQISREQDEKKGRKERKGRKL